MSDSINAVSKFRQDTATLKKMTERAVGGGIKEFKADELGGGFCNAVYIIEADGRKMVLKIAPPPEIVMMRHEKDITVTEAKMLKLLAEKTDIPAPELIYFDDSRELCPVEYFFMSFMEGQPLMTLKPYPDEEHYKAIKFKVGEICRKISSIEGDCFNIPAIPETCCDNNCDFMKKLFTMLIDDAHDRTIPLPEFAEKELVPLIETLRAVMNEAAVPCLMHTDTWDGNLMVKNNELVGMIDFAALLYGDPLMNHDFHDFGELRQEFLDGFGKPVLTHNEQIRTSFYKLWQQLGMIVERGYRCYDDSTMYDWVYGEFDKETAHLKALLA